MNRSSPVRTQIRNSRLLIFVIHVVKRGRHFSRPDFRVLPVRTMLRAFFSFSLSLCHREGRPFNKKHPTCFRQNATSNERRLCVCVCYLLCNREPNEFVYLSTLQSRFRFFLRIETNKNRRFDFFSSFFSHSKQIMQ